MKQPTVFINDIEVPLNGQRNLLEVIREANIDLPTFCYFSELSVYGACRLCMVDIEGRGLQPACSTPAVDGMRVRTNTQEIRKMRKMIVELILASHSQDCSFCTKGPDCQLKELARKVGITEIRFKREAKKAPIDDSSPSIIRDPSKCVLCGDCVRVCSEIQSIGAIDFAYRGSNAQVLPCFGKNLDDVECVNCGQCVRVCPTAALLPKSEISNVWEDIHNPQKLVVAQIAPAVRVAIGEKFGLEPGVTATNQIIASLKIMGFDKVFDTSFTADLTVIEETNEFLSRLNNKERLPLFTSCCPSWVKFVEQFYPDYISNLSSCKSPQQMFGSLCKETLSKELGIDKKDIVVVSIMPCTAKKFEAKRPEFMGEHGPDVDHVLTTQELALMIEESGIRFNELQPVSFDLPFGYKTGAGIIFGNSSGVTEAVLRYATEKVTGTKTDKYEYKFVRGSEGIKELTVQLGEHELKIAVVSSLKNAKMLMESIKKGEKHYDFVEVMACPGGCVGGGGQPPYKDYQSVLKRTSEIYRNDKMQQLHKSQDNPYIKESYEKLLQKPGSQVSHELLHTHYKTRKRIKTEDVSILNNKKDGVLDIVICFGTSCFIKGSQNLMKQIMEYLKANDILANVSIEATFCFEKCNRGPVVKIGGKVIEKCTLAKAIDEIEKAISVKL